MRKEIEFEIDIEAHSSYRPVVVYYDDNNNVFDRSLVSFKSILDQITENDLSEFIAMSKQSLQESIDAIYATHLNNSEMAFIKHKRNYESFLLMKRYFEEKESV
jgi:hypothetical protein